MRKVLAAMATVGFFAVAAYAGEVEGTEQGVEKTINVILLDEGLTSGATGGMDLDIVQAGQGDDQR